MKKLLLFLSVLFCSSIYDASHAQCTLTTSTFNNPYCGYSIQHDSIDLFSSVSGGTATSYTWTSNGTGFFRKNDAKATYKYSAKDQDSGLSYLR